MANASLATQRILAHLHSSVIPLASLNISYEIGSGAYAKVYKAKQHGNLGTVALKCLRGEHASSPVELSLFLEEALLLSRCNHRCGGMRTFV